MRVLATAALLAAVLACTGCESECGGLPPCSQGCGNAVGGFRCCTGGRVNTLICDDFHPDIPRAGDDCIDGLDPACGDLICTIDRIVVSCSLAVGELAAFFGRDHQSPRTACTELCASGAMPTQMTLWDKTACMEKVVIDDGVCDRCEALSDAVPTSFRCDWNPCTQDVPDGDSWTHERWAWDGSHCLTAERCQGILRCDEALCDGLATYCRTDDVTDCVPDPATAAQCP